MKIFGVLLIIIIIVGFIYVLNPQVNLRVNYAVGRFLHNLKANDFGECPSNIIPDTFSTDNSFRDINPINKWVDGTKMVLSPEGVWRTSTGKIDKLYYNGFEEFECRVGSEENENINYLYCSPLDYKTNNKKIDSSGNVILNENIYYQIKLVLEKESIPNTSMHKVVDATCKLIDF